MVDSRRLVLLAMSLLVLASCRSRADRQYDYTTPPPQVGAGPQYLKELHRLALQVQSPPDAYAEADAIKRLRAWMTSHRATYTIRATPLDANEPVPAASTQIQPLSVKMEIFRGRELLYDFTFIPRDNRNLALLGQ